MRASGCLTLHVAEPRLDVAALRRIPTVEGNLVLLQKMLIEAIGVDIISTGWALVDSDWPYNRQSAQGTSNRHCARFDVAGRCLAVAATTGSTIFLSSLIVFSHPRARGHPKQTSITGPWRAGRSLATTCRTTLASKAKPCGKTEGETFRESRAG